VWFVALKRVLGWFLVVLAPTWAIVFLLHARAQDALGFDLERIVVPASRALIHGQPIYLTAEQWHQHSGAFYYVYPPFYAEALTPLLAIPEDVRILAGVIACLSCAVAALLIVGVRDPRVLAAGAASFPVVFGAQVVNASMLVMLLVAVAWRCRSSWPLALALTIKPFVSPLALWLLWTRGRRSAVTFAVLSAGVLLASWALIGFEGVWYPATVAQNTDSQLGISYGIGAAFAHGQLVAFALTAAALAACWRRARLGDEIGSFTYALAAGIALSPISWMHTFAVLLLPLALRRPGFTPVWLIPLASWILGPGLPISLAAKLPLWIVAAGLTVWLGQGAPRFALVRHPWPLSAAPESRPIVAQTAISGRPSREAALALLHDSRRG
jgi:hypothetical protein